MGTVINFPEVRRGEREYHPAPGMTATVTILPVVRIERLSDQPPNEASTGPAAAPGRRRRRRARRP